MDKRPISVHAHEPGQRILSNGIHFAPVERTKLSVSRRQRNSGDAYRWYLYCPGAPDGYGSTPSYFNASLRRPLPATLSPVCDEMASMGKQTLRTKAVWGCFRPNPWPAHVLVFVDMIIGTKHCPRIHNDRCSGGRYRPPWLKTCSRFLRKDRSKSD